MREGINRAELLEALKTIYENLMFENSSTVIEAFCAAYLELGDLEFVVNAMDILKAHTNNELDRMEAKILEKKKNDNDKYFSN